MSKVLKAILLGTAASLLILQLFNNVCGKEISVTVSLHPADGTVMVSGELTDPNNIRSRRNLPFLKDSAGIEKLGERIKGLVLTDDNGRDVKYRQLIPGEFLSEGSFVKLRYLADLKPRPDRSAAARLSWLSDDAAMIYLADLLPQLSPGDGRTSAMVNFDLPPEWQVYSTEKRDGESAFETQNAEQSVFIIGKGLRERTINIGDHRLGLVMGDGWRFTDDEAVSAAKEIYQNYRHLFGDDPTGTSQIALMKFPVSTSIGNWEADTRGKSVTILSSDMPFKTQSLQRLHEQMRHEIFHLWIPNGIRLAGNYDWFYEGFALYVSLKSGVLLNRIRFEDFLDTLGRAHTIDSFQNPRISLIDASKKRWTGGNDTVYARGMITAFLCDVALLNRSRGQISVADVLRKLFEKFKNASSTVDGSEAALGVLGEYPELRPLIEKYIKGNSAVDWVADLSAAGIESEEKNLTLKLKMIEKPNNRQKALLDRLGYNSWRKIVTNSR